MATRYPDVQKRISQVTSENNDLEFDLFKAVLDEAIPANHAPFINKTIN